MNRYWDGDGAWLAVDAKGQVAVLTTAGVAPIPMVVLGFYPDLSLEAEVLAMPCVGGFERHVKLPSTESWINFAERGFFGYDWRDAEVGREPSRAYERITSPTVRIRLQDLSPRLAQFARLVTLHTIAFDHASAIPAGRIAPYREG